MTQITANEQTLFINTFRNTLQRILKILERWKTTTMEDNFPLLCIEISYGNISLPPTLYPMPMGRGQFNQIGLNTIIVKVLSMFPFHHEMITWQDSGTHKGGSSIPEPISNTLFPTKIST